MKTVTTGEVGEAVRRAMGSIQRFVVRRPGDAGPTPTELWLLERLTDQGWMRMSELAVWHRVDKSTVTALVKRLVARGWAQRGTDPADGRVVTVAITDEGSAVLGSSLARERALLDEVLSGWDDDDLADLSRLLTRLAAALDGHSRS